MKGGITITAGKDSPWIRMSDFNKLQEALVYLQRKYDFPTTTQGFKVVTDDRYEEVIKQKL